MFGPRIELFKLYGFKIRLDWTWFLILLLVTWSFAANVFPATVPDLSRATYWVMGLIGALGLFVSILLHEMGHAVVARAHGLRIGGITLFVFGGVAEMQDEPRSARAEFLVAVAGPIVSVVLFLLFLLVSTVGGLLGVPAAVTAVTYWLGIINGVVVLFNLIPGFPLDGGRILRSALWHWKGNLRWATRITSTLGAAFGLALIFLGVFDVIVTGNWIGGMWLALIGLFLRGAAQMSYQQLLIRQMLEGEKVRDFMKTEPQTVSSSVSLRDFVEDHVYRHHYKMFPVVDDGKLLGCISTKQLESVPREEWQSRSVGDVVEECSEENTIDPETDAMEALSKMQRSGRSRLVAARNGELAGVLSLKDMMHFLSLKIELEGGDDTKPRPRELERQAESVTSTSTS